MSNIEFTLSVDELKEFLSLKGKDAYDQLNNRFGGLDSLAQKLHTNLKLGINDTDDEIKQRIKKYDTNILPNTQSSFYQLGLNVLNGKITFGHMLNETFIKLKREKREDELAISVIRNGEIKQINPKKLVVGDICLIKKGDYLPADGVLINSENELVIDEKALTGEDVMSKKSTLDNLTLLSGTEVKEGNGQYMVLAVGPNSSEGQIYQLMIDSANNLK